MSGYAATRRRKAVAYADTKPQTGANSATYALVFLLVIGCVTDVQGVALLPLGKMEAALHLSAAETSWTINSLCFLLALSFGGSWGWDSAAIIALFVVGAVILGAWIYQQRVTKHALVDFKGMDIRQVTAGYSVYCTVAITASGLYILEPGLAQTPGVAGYGFGATVLRSSLALLPILPASFVAAAISKPMLSKLGPRPPIALGGVLCVIAFAMMAFLHSSLWVFYLEVAIYGVGIIIAFNVGWALTASAGRQDNMSTTFGIQYAMALPAAALSVAVILAVEAANVKVVPALGGAVLPKEGAYVAMFLMLAGISLVGYVINGLFIVPRHLRHQSARLEEIIAAEDALETGTPGIAGIADDLV